jgi:hypothetical protein
MPADTRSFVDIIQDVVSNVQEIVSSEIRLAKVEVTNEAKEAARASMVFAVGALLDCTAWAFCSLPRSMRSPRFFRIGARH